MSNELKIFKKKDSPYWYVRGTLHGQKIYESTGIPHKSLKKHPPLVTDYRNKRVQQLRESFIYGKSQTATFLDAALNYLKSGGSPRFLGEYKDGQWTKLLGQIGQDKLKDLTQDYLDDIANRMYGHCTAETTNRQFWTPFIAVWKFNSKGQNALCRLVEWQRPKQKKSKSRAKKAVSYDEAITFINALSYPAAKIMFFLFWSGCRPGEAFSLKSKDVNPQDSWLSLEETKTDMPRGVPIHRALTPLMTYLKEQNEFIFLNSKGVPYPSGKQYNKAGRIIQNSGGQLASPINTAKKITKLNITPYSARHTVSTHLIWPCGVSDMIKDEILGHASQNEMSKHYTHLPRKALIDEINELPYPNGLREDLLNPCRIRAEHESKHLSKTSQIQSDQDLGDVAEWLKALPC